MAAAAVPPMPQTAQTTGSSDGAGLNQWYKPSVVVGPEVTISNDDMTDLLKNLDDEVMALQYMGFNPVTFRKTLGNHVKGDIKKFILHTIAFYVSRGNTLKKPEKMSDGGKKLVLALKLAGLFLGTPTDSSTPTAARISIAYAAETAMALHAARDTKLIGALGTLPRSLAFPGGAGLIPSTAPNLWAAWLAWYRSFSAVVPKKPTEEELVKYALLHQSNGVYSDADRIKVLQKLSIPVA